MREDSSAIYVARGASYLIIQNIASTTISIAAFGLIARLSHWQRIINLSNNNMG